MTISGASVFIKFVYPKSRPRNRISGVIWSIANVTPILGDWLLFTVLVDEICNLFSSPELPLR
jgi:hypothetical protein